MKKNIIYVLAITILFLFYSSCGKEDLCEANTDAICGCYEIYAPVCGCDGETYENDCRAECVGVDYVPGPCN